MTSDECNNLKKGDKVRLVQQFEVYNGHILPTDVLIVACAKIESYYNLTFQKCRANHGKCSWNTISNFEVIREAPLTPEELASAESLPSYDYLENFLKSKHEPNR